MTNKEALELSLITLERDELKVGNIYVNYDIKKALIRLVKKKLEKKKQKDSKDEQHKPMHPAIKKMYEDYFDKHFEETSKKREWVGLTEQEQSDIAWQKDMSRLWIVTATEAKLKEKNCG